MKKTVFILDDEQDITDLVRLHLERAGFLVEGFVHPADFLTRLRAAIPSIVILDLMLPGTDGMEICRRMKGDARLAAVPIIMLTAKREEADKVSGLDTGADDYVTKPFSPRELVSRVKAVLRRANEEPGEVITVGDSLVIDLRRHEVRTDRGTLVRLTITEFDILVELVKKRGWVLTRDMLLRAVWGDDAYVVDRNIDVHIRHLREKLGDLARIIVNVRGVGYKIEE